MKKIILPILFVLMIWALIDQTTQKPNFLLQVVIVIVFFYAMMKLMAKTSNNKKE